MRPVPIAVARGFWTEESLGATKVGPASAGLVEVLFLEGNR